MYHYIRTLKPDLSFATPTYKPTRPKNPTITNHSSKPSRVNTSPGNIYLIQSAFRTLGRTSISSRCLIKTARLFGFINDLSASCTTKKKHTYPRVRKKRTPPPKARARAIFHENYWPGQKRYARADFNRSALFIARRCVYARRVSFLFFRRLSRGLV